jgi:hypothetical protein
VLGAVANAFGDIESEIVSTQTGIVIGRTNMPVVYEGDALFHVAETARAEAAAEGISAHLDVGPLFDEDEII